MTIGVALLGITHPHTSGRAEVFAELPDVKLLAVYDKDPVVEPLSRYTGLPIRSPSDILSDRAVDIILVHSQTEEMVDYCVAALDAGKSVLVEKPCGTGPEDLNRLVEAQERSSSVLQAGFNFRFSPVVEAMKEIARGISAGRSSSSVAISSTSSCICSERPIRYRQPWPSFQKCRTRRRGRTLSPRA
jgi:predicted dehydrogenase